jgi:hypothetical protein
MVTTLDVECELVGLIDFVETGLFAPSLRKRLGHFPPVDLKMALRDLLDWMSLRGILRGREADLGGRVHPLTGRVVARLAGLSQYVCVPDGRLAYRVEVGHEEREALEDFVKERIWHPAWAGRGRVRERAKILV